jgi:hypothetical protein
MLINNNPLLILLIDKYEKDIKTIEEPFDKLIFNLNSFARFLSRGDN